MGIVVKGLLVLGSLILVFLVWILAGRHISLFLDRIKTVSIESLPTTPLTYSEEAGGILQIGKLMMSTTDPSFQPYSVEIDRDSQHRLVLSAAGKSFVLTREPGDETSFTVERSLLSWPTPFDLNFMTGHSPSWKRHLYYVLRWKKSSGSKLTMVWRYEQYFYDDWASGFMIRPGTTGLIQVEVSP
jgi:hypothetical protein